MPLLNYDVSLLIFSPCLFYFDPFVMTKALLSMIQFLSYGNSVTGYLFLISVRLVTKVLALLSF